MSDNMPDTSWLWQDWVPNGYVTLLGGVPGVGKSGIALGLAKVYLCDERWPDETAVMNGPPERRRVLWLETEDSHGILRDRAQRWGVPATSILCWGADGYDRPQLDAEGMADTLVEAVRENGIGLVILDTLAGAHYQEENSANIKKVVQVLSTVASRCNIAVLALHHLRKAREGEGEVVSLDRLRGSSAIAAQARVVLAASPELTQDGMVRLCVLKSNMVDDKPAPVCSVLTETGPVWTVAAGDGPLASEVRRRRALVWAAAVAWLKETLPPGTTMTVPELKQRWAAASLGGDTYLKAVRTALGVVWWRDKNDFFVRMPLEGEVTAPTSGEPEEEEGGGRG